MSESSRQWLAPLTGLGFIVVGIVSFAIGGEPKDAGHPAQEIVDFYVDNKDSIQIGAFLGVPAGALLAFFGAYLRGVLRAAAGEGETLSILALIGLCIVALGFAIDGTILIATAEAADDLEPASVQALQALWDNDFLPIVLGVLIFDWAAGLSILRSGALPRWMGWALIVFGVLAVTPVGFAAAIGTALWILVASIVLSMRARSAQAAS
ncbi:MAG: hypothetical protein ACXWZK_03250 [Solirubrobacterales bacterium]